MVVVLELLVVEVVAAVAVAAAVGEAVVDLLAVLQILQALLEAQAKISWTAEFTQRLLFAAYPAHATSINMLLLSQRVTENRSLVSLTHHK